MSDSTSTQQKKHEDEIAKQHNEQLTRSLNEMRKAGVKCDCRIDVTNQYDTQSSEVHSAVVSAASNICRNTLLTSPYTLMVCLRKKCFNKKTIDLKEVLEQCIEFMYIGKAEIRDDTAEAITIISHKLQLKPLEDMSLARMHNNLTSFDNCNSLLSVARYCCREKYEAQAIKKWILLNLQQQNKCSSPENLWKSAVNLRRSSRDFREECKMLEVVNAIQIEKVDFNYMLEKIMKNSLVTSDIAAAKHVFHVICRKINEQPLNLTTENYYTVKKLLEKYGCEEAFDPKEILKTFSIKTFEVLVQQDEFCNVQLHEIIFMLASPELLCTEKIKFNAIVKWTRHEPQRADTFSKVFNMIKLQNLSEKELIDVKKDPLVESNAPLLSSVFDALAKKKESSASYLQNMPYTARWLLTQVQKPEGDNSLNASSGSMRSRGPRSGRHSSGKVSNFSTASLTEDLLSLETSSDTEAEVYDRAYFSQKPQN